MHESLNTPIIPEHTHHPRTNNAIKDDGPGGAVGERGGEPPRSVDRRGRPASGGPPPDAPPDGQGRRSPPLLQEREARLSALVVVRQRL